MLALLWITSGIVIAALLGAVIYYLRRSIKLAQKLAATSHELIVEQNKAQQLTVEMTQIRNQFNETRLHDPLTGLPSRQVFEDRLLQTLNQSKRHNLVFAVLFLDLDEFKMVNSALGHDVGDLLLKEVADRLQTCIRQVDTVSRFTGDEFVFLLPQLIKSETVAYVAQRFLEAISQPFYIEQQELFVTASIGISIYPIDGKEPKMLLKNAESALHQAKSRGHNIYQFYREEMYALSQRELLLNTSLHSDSIYDEFTLYYQPQMNVEQKKIVTMEALIRWQHPELGLITPGEFIRLAETSGRIIAIGEWVLRQACEQFNRWRADGFAIQCIAVNVSMRQLENPHFSHKVSQILQETEIDPECLILEIAEGVLLPKLELVEKSLHMLKHLGVQIAIDDFGTGNLSLQHLRRFPIDCLKIDGSLVQDVTINKESVAIIRMIVALADSLQLDAVAEGVEYPKQKQVLLELGCYLMQGHLFSLPRLPHEFTKIMVQGITESI